MRLSFIVVEHAEIDIYIVTELIRKVLKEAEVEVFLTAEKALDHIVINKVAATERKIILLDLMMPKMDGASFISLFEALPSHIRANYQIAIVTSSMNKTELERLGKRRDVEMVIEKPLTRDKFRSLLEKINVEIN